MVLYFHGLIYPYAISSYLLLDYGQVSIEAAFGGEAFIREDAYFDLIIKWCGAYSRLGAYKGKYGNAKHAEYSQ